MTNQEFANGLRLIADFYEAQPEMPQFSIYTFTDRLGFLNALKALKTRGMVTKDLSDQSFNGYAVLKQPFGEIPFQVNAQKSDICERIVTYKCPDSLLEEVMNAEEGN
jgi:hypothetical protein